MPAKTGLGKPRQGTHLSMLRTTHLRNPEGALILPIYGEVALSSPFHGEVARSARGAGPEGPTDEGPREPMTSC
jgi:hypothetical protein